MQKIDRGEVELITPEFNMRLNTDKRVIFDALLGCKKEDLDSTPAFQMLFEKYFKGRVNQEFTVSDLQDLSEEIKTTIKLETLSRKIKKGQYVDNSGKNKSSSIFKLLEKEKTTSPVTNECIIGSSSIDNAVWFHFTNEIGDVCSGSIYLRTSPIKKLTLFSTFEVNPFIASKAIREDRVLANYDEKPVVTFNPNWLIHTLRDIEKQIFSKLIA